MSEFEALAEKAEKDFDLGEFARAVRACRSYRRFDEGDPVPEALLIELVDLARVVASGANRMPLRYRIVSSPASARRCSRSSSGPEPCLSGTAPRPVSAPRAISWCATPAMVPRRRWTRASPPRRFCLRRRRPVTAAACCTRSTRPASPGHWAWRMPACLRSCHRAGRPAEEVQPRAARRLAGRLHELLARRGERAPRTQALAGRRPRVGTACQHAKRPDGVAAFGPLALLGMVLPLFAQRALTLWEASPATPDRAGPRRWRRRAGSPRAW